MIDNLKGQEELEVEKIKVTEAEIVVRGTIDKPYYVIVYHEVGKNYENEGFGSYRLENVFEWRNKRFEKVDEKEQAKTDWIPCEVKLPPMPKENPLFDNKPIEIYLVSLAYADYPVRAFWNGKDFTDGWSKLDVEAWMNLPQPYKKEGAENE